MIKILKLGSNHTCLAVISLDSALKNNEDQNYYPQVILKEANPLKKRKRSSFHDSDDD